MGVRVANREYERWLKSQLQGQVVAADLTTKHEKMTESAFAFLRATYWRWSEKILEVCTEAANAPAVLAVGDIHLENFGTWTDEEGRICFGVNDYDEAAEMPYLLDLIRLAASALLAPARPRMQSKTICTHLLNGYRQGIERPQAWVLDRDHLWLRARLVVDEKARTRFWDRVDKQHRKRLRKRKPEQPAKPWLDLFSGALPEPGGELVYWRRTAGTGSLGRPRWLGYGNWRGGPLLREGKALVPSAWVRAHGGAAGLRLNEIATGKYRAKDPWYAQHGHLLVRRLSPNNRKINIERPRDAELLLHPHLLEAMGRDLAAIHLGTGDRREAVAHDLAKRKARWFRTGTEAAAAFVVREFNEFKKSAK